MPGNRNSVRQNSWYDLIKQRSRKFRPAVAGDRRLGRRHGEALHASRRTQRHPRAAVGRGGEPAPVRAAGMAARRRPRRSKSSTAGCALRSRRGRQPSRPARRIDPVCAPARCSAARWCIGCCNRCPMSQPSAARDAALRYLARNAGDWSEAEREALADAMLALIADPRFAPVFAPGSRAEVSIAGRLERPGRPPALVSGQIDRLVVTAERGPDRRLQDQPRPAGRRGRGSRGLYPPARALPRGAAKTLSPAAGPGSAALDRNA